MERVTEVYDGDSFATEVRQVRLAYVDTPEKHQQGYEEARSALTALIWLKPVDVRGVSTDIYGRTVAYVTVLDELGRTIDVNETMKQYE